MDTQYTDYDMNNPSNVMILAQQNAGNIAYLKQRMDDLGDLKSIVMDSCGNIVLLNDQLQTLIENNANLQTNLVGTTPPNITGATSDVPDTTNTTD